MPAFAISRYVARRGLGAGDIPSLVEQTAIQYGVDPSLALSVARAESGFDPSVVSGAGAIGVMQLMPGTAADLGVNPWDPLQNIVGGIRYLKQQLDRFGGNVQAALVAYNWGPGNAQRWLSGQTGLPSETANYVSSVMGDVAVQSSDTAAGGAGPSSVTLPAPPDLLSLFDTGGGDTLVWWIAGAALLGIGILWLTGK